MSNSVSDEVSVTYLADDLSYETATPEDTEELVIKKLPLKEAIQMAIKWRNSRLYFCSKFIKITLLIRKSINFAP